MEDFKKTLSFVCHFPRPGAIFKGLDAASERRLRGDEHGAPARSLPRVLRSINRCPAAGPGAWTWEQPWVGVREPGQRTQPVGQGKRICPGCGFAASGGAGLNSELRVLRGPVCGARLGPGGWCQALPAGTPHLAWPLPQDCWGVSFGSAVWTMPSELQDLGPCGGLGWGAGVGRSLLGPAFGLAVTISPVSGAGDALGAAQLGRFLPQERDVRMPQAVAWAGLGAPCRVSALRRGTGGLMVATFPLVGGCAAPALVVLLRSGGAGVVPGMAQGWRR